MLSLLRQNLPMRAAVEVKIGIAVLNIRMCLGVALNG